MYHPIVMCRRVFQHKRNFQQLIFRHWHKKAIGRNVRFRFPFEPTLRYIILQHFTLLPCKRSGKKQSVSKFYLMPGRQKMFIIQFHLITSKERRSDRIYQPAFPAFFIIVSRQDTSRKRELSPTARSIIQYQLSLSHRCLTGCCII